ncbi:IFNL3 protein, partial [Campylorhamphus procurvoides]|nr:IFNL3 protein [Campylorhamphus procurvoides]
MLCLRLTPLLVLVLVVSLGAAFPHEGAPRKGCSLFKYKQVIFHEMKAVEKMQKEFRSIRRLDRTCNTRLLDREWTSAHLSVPDRVLLVQAELNFTIAMLQRPARPSFARTRQRPLAFLAQAREDLQGCVAPSHQPSGELRQWLQNLQLAMQTVTQENISCLEDYAIRHLFEVLGDLNCAARQEKC